MDLDAAAWPSIGPYRLVEAVATGTSASVWRAVDERGREVIVKRYSSAAADAGRTLQAEASALRRVRHQNVVPLIDIAASPTEIGLVFPRLPGRSLADKLAAEGALDATPAAHIAASVADGLAAVHRARIVHRDVKPGNILLGEDGVARLFDFGIAVDTEGPVAHERDASGAPLTVGTLPYMAPEQALATGVSPATDVFALGVVLYEMLAGRPPFNAVEPATLIVEQRLPPARIASAPAPLMDLVLACLALEAASRPSAAAVAATLHGWLSAAPAAAQPTVIVPAVAPSARPRPIRRRAAFLAGTAGLLTLAMVAGAGAGLIKISQPSTASGGLAAADLSPSVTPALPEATDTPPATSAPAVPPSGPPAPVAPAADHPSEQQPAVSRKATSGHRGGGGGSKSHAHHPHRAKKHHPKRHHGRDQHHGHHGPRRGGDNAPGENT